MIWVNNCLQLFCFTSAGSQGVQFLLVLRGVCNMWRWVWGIWWWCDSCHWEQHSTCGHELVSPIILGAYIHKLSSREHRKKLKKFEGLASYSEDVSWRKILFLVFIYCPDWKTWHLSNRYRAWIKDVQAWSACQNFGAWHPRVIAFHWNHNGTWYLFSKCSYE